ncbi:hypothetical protein OPIT5_00380 (plasmid) [Opitutaceae bacterium TAV5]|nr:hypothetical protein OPIT5_00380 [Opitutaceae bacterium TAV5]
MTQATTGPIDVERFRAEIARIRARPPHARVVDVLVPLREDIEELRGEGRTVMEIWRAVGEAGYRVSYPNFVRAVNELLKGPVRPLFEARRRARERRRMIPVVPESVNSESVSAAPATHENAILARSRENLAEGLRGFRVKNV